MAVSKQLAAVLVVACVFAAAVPNAASYAGADMPPESCETQVKYFVNCLARDEIREQCCSVLADRKCLCELKQEVAVPCHPHHHHPHGPCPGKNKGAPPVKLSELQHLPCFQGLKCH